MLPSENKTQDQPPQKNETVRAPSLTTPPKDHHTRELLPQRTLIDLPKENNPITQLCSELTKEFTSLKLILYLNPNPTSQIAPLSLISPVSNTVLSTFSSSSPHFILLR